MSNKFGMWKKKINLMRLTPHDVRVAAGRTHQGRVTEFVQKVKGRYVALHLPWPILDLVLRQSCYSTVSQNFHHHAHTHIARLLELKISIWPTRTSSLSSNSQLVPLLRIEREIGTDTIRLKDSSPMGPVIVEQLIRRLITQGKRVETLQDVVRPGTGHNRFLTMDPGTPSWLPIPMVQPVRKVIRRSMPVKNEADPMQHSAEEIGGNLRKEIKAVNPGQRRQDTQIDVNLLTDQVIQAIDRRIIAQRERMGRI